MPIAACLRTPRYFLAVGAVSAADEPACEINARNSIASDGERHNAIRAAMATRPFARSPEPDFGPLARLAVRI